MRTWEQTVSYGLRALGLESIRNKLLAFAVLATLIPSISTAWVSYAHNQRSLTENGCATISTRSGIASPTTRSSSSSIRAPE